MKEYLVAGKGYRVKPEDLAEFLAKYPNAIERASEPGKTTSSADTTLTGRPNALGSRLEVGSLEQPLDLSINPDTGKEYTFTEKLSNIFEPVVPQFVNMGEQFAQSGIIALDKMYKTMLPKDGYLSNLVEKVSKKSGLMIDPEGAEEFDSGTLVDQLLYITGDYDGDLKLFKDLSKKEKETMGKIAKGEIDTMGKVIAEQQKIIDKRL